MRYHKPKRNRFRRNDRGFGRDGFRGSKIGGIGSSDHQRKSFNRNGQNPEKLLETYNNLAKEAFSNGDEILSESYYQYADHFLRVIENRNSTQNNPKPNSGNSPIEESSEEKIILEDEKASTSAVARPQNGEDI